MEELIGSSINLLNKFSSHRFMGEEILRSSKVIWNNFAKDEEDKHLLFPAESLIRIFNGPYVDVPKPPAKLLDHGFGSGNNLSFFAEKGYEIYGCEVVDSLVNVAREKFSKISERPEDCFKIINGTKLDYEDNFFDIIVSWNAIHYNGTKNSVKEVIAEFYRILKPGGVLVLSTLHPEHSILKRGQNDGEGSFVLNEPSKFDNRRGLTFYCPKSHEEFLSLWQNFSDVKYGHYSYDLFLPTYSHSARLIYATK